MIKLGDLEGRVYDGKNCIQFTYSGFLFMRDNAESDWVVQSVIPFSNGFMPVTFLAKVDAHDPNNVPMVFATGMLQLVKACEEVSDTLAQVSYMASESVRGM